MEMHQVRYFLAVSRTLNFTRAAEQCNVAQPSLTRAIRQLEGELGGDLFRRERPQAQLTELGQRMLPLLRQCYDSAVGARSLASSLKSGEVGALRLALSQGIDINLLLPVAVELGRHFRNLELKFLRGTALDVAGFLKRGDAELAIAAPIGEEWERFDSWPLFSERFGVIASAAHPIAGRSQIDVREIRNERLLVRGYCEQAGELAELMRGHDIDVTRGHEVASERDLIALVEANLGIAVVPNSTHGPPALARASINDLQLTRTIYLYAVAGRERTTAASVALKLLRASNWSKYTS
jgi:DNA-binding transcriptional LysR family regulator